MSNLNYRKVKSADQLTEEKAFSKILRLATACEQSTCKLRARLLRDGFDEGVVESALTRAIEYGIVSDARFAESYVRSKLASGRGCKGIERELAELGLSAYETEAYRDYAEEGEEQELARAVRLLDSRPPRSKNLRDGAFRKLVQQGYSVGVASCAARIWLDKQSM